MPRCKAFFTFGIVAIAIFGGAGRASATEATAHAVLERLIGTAAAQLSLVLVPPGSLDQAAPVDEFSISGSPGNIVITGTTTRALTRGAGWYLKYVALADVGLRGGEPRLPAILPASPAEIRRIANVPHRYAFNDTNDGYTDPYLSWAGWERRLDLIALQGINEIHITVGTDYVFWQLMQRYGYGADELRSWIPDPAHQPWWLLQNMSRGDAAISEALLMKRAQLGRQIADRARELGITPVFPGYWGTVPADFAARNPGADVIPQGEWVGYQRPGWLNPLTPLFRQVAADYYAISADVLGPSTMYKMDPLHEGGVLGHVDVAQAATAIEAALRATRDNATWVILGWQGNPLPDLLAGVADKSRLLILAAQADSLLTWDGGQQWPGVAYALGSIYSFGGRTTMGANAAAIVDRWFADRSGPNAAQLRGIALFPESWPADNIATELMSELPWTGNALDLDSWFRIYATGRYGTHDAHALAAWSILARTVYATPADGYSDGHDSLFNAEPSLTAKGAACCSPRRMRYSGSDLETAWRELILAAPAITHTAAYRFDLTDLTRQVIVNRARALLPLVRRAFDRSDSIEFETLASRWLGLMDLADRVEATHGEFMLGPRLDNAKANASTQDERAELARSVVNLITNWGTREGYDAGLRDYANRDWSCLTSRYYRPRWSLYFQSLRNTLGGATADAIDWYKLGDDFASADHTGCTLTPTSDIVELAMQAQALLDAGPEASRIPEGWSSYTSNDARIGNDGDGFIVDSAGADLWTNVNEFGALYQRGGLRDGDAVTARVASMASEGNRPWARAGIMTGTDIVASQPGGFANIAVTPSHGCVFSWAKNTAAGLTEYRAAREFAAPVWLRLSRRGNAYTGSCSSDGVAWTVVGRGTPGDVAKRADVGLFASAVNAGASDRLQARFDGWSMSEKNPPQ